MRTSWLCQDMQKYIPACLKEKNVAHAFLNGPHQIDVCSKNAYAKKKWGGWEF